MQRVILSFILFLFLLAVFPITQAQAQADKADKIKSAMSSAPSSIADQATIMDWPAAEDGEMVVLREGTNGWTCLPDLPATPGYDPMCLDQPWLVWADAWMHKTEPNITKMGFGYMLQGGSPESNTDPYAEGPTDDNEWMDKGVPHLMILVPNAEMLSGLPTNPADGGPWVMWRNTPYVHIMAPMPKHMPEHK